MKFCTACGKQLGEETRFCGACGKEVRASAPQTPPVTTAPNVETPVTTATKVETPVTTATKVEATGITPVTTAPKVETPVVTAPVAENPSPITARSSIPETPIAPTRPPVTTAQGTPTAPTRPPVTTPQATTQGNPTGGFSQNRIQPMAQQPVKKSSAFPLIASIVTVMIVVVGVGAGGYYWITTNDDDSHYVTADQVESYNSNYVEPSVETPKEITNADAIAYLAEVDDIVERGEVLISLGMKSLNNMKSDPSNATYKALVSGTITEMHNLSAEMDRVSAPSSVTAKHEAYFDAFYSYFSSYYELMSNAVNGLNFGEDILYAKADAGKTTMNTTYQALHDALCDL